MKHSFSLNTQTGSSLRSSVFVCVGLGDPLQVRPLSQRRQCAVLHLDYSFSSCSLHWHRVDAPGAPPSQTPPASKILKGEYESKAQATPALAARQRETEGGEAEMARQQERTEPAKVSDHSRGESGGCPDFDEEQQLRQEGGIIKKSGKGDCYYSLSQAVKSTMQCLHFLLTTRIRLYMYALRSTNKPMWLPV